jgi:hypothetical protein
LEKGRRRQADAEIEWSLPKLTGRQGGRPHAVSPIAFRERLKTGYDPTHGSSTQQHPLFFHKVGDAVSAVTDIAFDLIVKGLVRFAPLARCTRLSVLLSILFLICTFGFVDCSWATDVASIDADSGAASSSPTPFKLSYSLDPTSMLLNENENVPVFDPTGTFCYLHESTEDKIPQ